jgi:hypothetical protein
MKHCKWDTHYPDVDKEFKCNQPATVEVFEISGRTIWVRNDKDEIIGTEYKQPASMGWLCPEHAMLFNTGRNAINGFIGKYFLQKCKEIVEG